MDLTDAALWERAEANTTCDGRLCEPQRHAHGPDCAIKERLCDYLALRDAALRQGELQEAAKHADCCVAREELDAARADLAVPCQRHGCMWDAPEAHETCRAEQREASAKIIYDLAHSMADRGLFVKDDFGEPSIHAIHELEAAIRSAR